MLGDRARINPCKTGHIRDCIRDCIRFKIKETLPDSELFDAELSFHYNRNIIKANLVWKIIANIAINRYTVYINESYLTKNDLLKLFTCNLHK